MLASCSFLPIQSDTDFYGLIIGINDYTYLDPFPEGDLLYCEDDASSIYYSLIENGWKTEELTLLLGSNATKTNINNTLIDCINQANENDFIFVFFSGHGRRISDADGDETDGLDEALVPVDYQPANSSPLITDDELSFIFSACGTEKGIFIIDACHSGGVINKSLAGTNIRVKSIDSITPKGSGGSGDLTITNFPVMTACSQNEYSYETGAFGHGVFSYFLLEGFQNLKADRNKDNYITIRELFNYAENHTETYTSMHAFPTIQHPAMRFPMDLIDILITR